MDSYNDVIVRPTEITFSRTAVNPVEVLILNRSQKRLRYKILCTARGTYALSKCKGTLCQEAFVKINIELIRVSLLEQNRRDFFKIQFFDCLDDSLQGERFISSVVLPDPTASSYRSLDSDSCNSWPNRSIDNLSVASNPPRALSLVRPMDSLSTCSGQSTLKGNQKSLPTALIRRGEHRSLVKPLTKPRFGLFVACLLVRSLLVIPYRVPSFLLVNLKSIKAQVHLLGFHSKAVLACFYLVVIRITRTSYF
ncbi:hypothetical protein CRM22_008800 [Opisthorchis felineus]|uniref:MSP domain-containing protein n=1 Tax=Opisthorchis felineus TaxID=147828 RepID=A0A4S2LA71_OPIFE|nr:hypothetical protein CRM22_008800 [Opisthorchis felineus]